MNRWWKWLLTVALTASLLGCAGKTNETGGSAAGGSPAPSAGQEKSGAPAQAQADGKRTQYPLTVKDATGQEFTFAKAPERIVSTSPAETETLFALGLGPKVVAVSDFCNYPAEAQAKPKVGGITKPNAEAILAVNADLVLTGVSMKSQTVKELRDAKINLFKVEPKTLDDVMNNILLMGQIFDVQAQADQVVNRMKEERRKVTEAVANLKPEEKKKVYIEFSPGWTVGKGEFMDELIRLAGGVNVASDIQGWAQINAETVIQQNPDVILYAAGVSDSKSGKTIEQLILERSGWDKITAIKEKRLAGLNQDILSRPGPRLTQGMVEMAKAIYPDKVKG